MVWFSKEEACPRRDKQGIFLSALNCHFWRLLYTTSEKKEMICGMGHLPLDLLLLMKIFFRSSLRWCLELEGTFQTIFSLPLIIMFALFCYWLSHSFCFPFYLQLSLCYCRTVCVNLSSSSSEVSILILNNLITLLTTTLLLPLFQLSAFISSEQSIFSPSNSYKRRVWI